MKRLSQILFSVVLAMAFVGCSDSSKEEEFKPAPIPEPDKKQTSYYITDYVIPTSINTIYKAEWYDPTGGNLHYDLLPFQAPITIISFDGESITEESDSEQFTQLRELYGDLHYTGQTRPHQNKALAYPIEKITLTTHEDFDADHPAGSVVDDVVKIHLSTYETFIKNNYVYPEGWTHRNYYGQGVMPIGEFYLSEVNEECSRLVPDGGGMIMLKFMKEPDVAGEYPFMLTITINGKAVSTTFKVTFGEITAEE